MSVSDDCLLLLHGTDGEQWARFIANRLSSPQYNIRSILRNISSTTQDHEPQTTNVSETINSTITTTADIDSIRGTNNSESNLDPSHFAVIQRDSGRGSETTINEFSSTCECITNTRGSVVFLSPDSIITCPFPFDVSFLNPRRTVFLFLGVDIEEVRTLFGEKSDAVFKCRCCVIDADETSVCDAMVQIIEAYEDVGGSSSVLDEEDEDDDDIYSTPGCPRQLNRIERVFPQELNETDRDVYILLERAAEDDVSVILEDTLSRKILLTCICERLYKFTMPSDASGETFFKVECQSHYIGAKSVRVLSKLDRLRNILNQEMNPLSIIASAVGLASTDLGGVDTALAFKLQQLAPALSFQRMFPCEDALKKSLKDERADVKYPSLLHFAADLNLRTFCSELLRYPGMLAAALTENCDGEYPSQIAARKGYTHLESDLVQFVERQNPSWFGKPKPHLSTNKPLDNINEQKPPSPISGLYIDMFNLNMIAFPTLDKQSQISDEEMISPLSESSENVFILSNDGDDNGAEKEAGLLRLGPDIDTSSIGSTSSKALKMLGIREEDIRPRSSTVNSSPSRSESPLSKHFDGTSPQNQMSPLVDPTTTAMRTIGEDSFLKGIYQQESKQRTFNKIVSFFGKIKNKRIHSEGENISISSRGLKKSLSNKSEKSSKGIFEADSNSRKKKSSDAETTERDSGSYSDEDKEKSLSGSNKKNGKSKEFKERGKPVTRRLSQRAHAASKECVRDAPELPSTCLRTEIFKDLNNEQF